MSRTSSYRFSPLLCNQFALIAIAPLVRIRVRVFNVFALALLLTALNFVIEKRRLRAVAFVLCGNYSSSGNIGLEWAERIGLGFKTPTSVGLPGLLRVVPSAA